MSSQDGSQTRRCGHHAFCLDDGELAAIPAGAPSPAEVAVICAIEVGGLCLEVGDGGGSCAGGAETKYACSGRNAVEAGFALAAGHGGYSARAIVIAARLPPMMVAPMVVMSMRVATAMAVPVMVVIGMVVAMPAPVMRIGRRVGHEQPCSCYDQRRTQLCERSHLELHRKKQLQPSMPSPRSCFPGGRTAHCSNSI